MKRKTKTTSKAWFKRHLRKIARRKGFVVAKRSHSDRIVGIAYKEREDLDNH